eukprot:jgi/Bigna1/79625/fgenesh1_pg.64_\
MPQNSIRLKDDTNLNVMVLLKSSTSTTPSWMLPPYTEATWNHRVLRKACVTTLLTMRQKYCEENGLKGMDLENIESAYKHCPKLQFSKRKKTVIQGEAACKVKPDRAVQQHLKTEHHSHPILSSQREKNHNDGKEQLPRARERISTQHAIIRRGNIIGYPKSSGGYRRIIRAKRGGTTTQIAEAIVTRNDNNSAFSSHSFRGRAALVTSLPRKSIKQLMQIPKLEDPSTNDTIASLQRKLVSRFNSPVHYYTAGASALPATTGFKIGKKNSVRNGKKRKLSAIVLPNGLQIPSIKVSGLALTKRRS